MACFLETALLRSAVTLYLTGSLQESAVVRKVYGNDISAWCVDELTDFSFVFSGHATFNVSLAAWNVSRAVSMRHLFQGATSFNQDLSSWDVRRVTSFQSTFEGASSFVGLGLEQWNVSAAIDMNRMFMNAPSLSANLAVWDTSRVASMQFMFDGASSFTGRGLEQWNVSNVTSLRGMFRGASHFDANLCRWSRMLSDSVDTDLMLDGTQCPYPNPWNKTSISLNSTSAFCQACLVTSPSTDNAPANSTLIADQQHHDRNRNDALTIIAALCCLIAVILSCWACIGRKDKRKALASPVPESPSRRQIRAAARISSKRIECGVGYKKEPLDDDDDSQVDTSSRAPVLSRPSQHHSDNDYYYIATTTTTRQAQPWSKSNVLDMSSDFGDFSVSSREQSDDKWTNE
jgi:surface protein